MSSTRPAVICSIVVIVLLAGTSGASARTVSWSGYDWDVKHSPGRRLGPGPNRWSNSRRNVWVDDRGRLHLRITQEHGRWYCAEVVARVSFGLGTYTWDVAGRPDRLDRNSVLGMFTWDDAPGDHHREIDVEFSRWGHEHEMDAGFTVQPYQHEGNGHRYDVLGDAGARTENSFTWASDHVDFLTIGADSSPISSWTYAGPDVPPPGAARPRINLWLFQGAEPSNGKDQEIVVSDFSFASAP